MSCCSNNSEVCPHAEKKRKNKQKLVLIVSFISLIFSFLISINVIKSEFFHYFNPAWIAVIICGKGIVMGAYEGLKEKRITSSLLITIALFASILLEVAGLIGLGDFSHHNESYIFAAGEIAFLMAIGAFIEDYTVRKSRSGIENLMKLSPTTAKIKVDDEIKEVAIGEIKIGDIVIALPNQIVPVDGKITVGATAIDESSMTGEWTPVDKTIGDNVFGGTWNKFGAIEIEVTKMPEDMAVAKMIELVKEAEGKKAPISRIADKWASYIVPLAVSLSIVVGFIAYFWLGVDVVTAVTRGVTILVVFCPCALALATPTAVAAGLGRGAKEGILIKSGGALEAMASIDTIAFDKTGTLTKGEIKVEEVWSNIDETEMITLLASAERYSEHPIATAILKYAKDKVTLLDPVNTESITGIGLKCQIDGKQILICSFKSLSIYNIADEVGTKIGNEMQEKGKTVIALCVDDTLVGLASLSDTIRSGSHAAIKKLESMGVNTLMLTGDNEFSAREIGKNCGISDIRHSLMPEGKVTAIEELVRQNSKVCMVGDGVNDSPALATATTSIAMGALGSDAAIETAEIALMSSDISKIPPLLILSRSVLNKIKGNITFSMSVNFLAVILSTYGLLNPVTGALVHNVSSVFVVLNSAMILNKKL